MLSWWRNESAPEPTKFLISTGELDPLYTKINSLNQQLLEAQRTLSESDYQWFGYILEDHEEDLDRIDKAGYYKGDELTDLMLELAYLSDEIIRAQRAPATPINSTIFFDPRQADYGQFADTVRPVERCGRYFQEGERWHEYFSLVACWRARLGV